MLPGSKDADGNYNTTYVLGFVEAKGSANEAYDMEQGTIDATRVFIGPWENRTEFIKTYLISVPVETTDGDTIHLPPDTYPEAIKSVAFKVDVEGMLTVDNNTSVGDDSLNLISYKFAKVTVSYHLPQGIDGDSYANGTEDVFNRPQWYVEERIDSTTETVEFKSSEFLDEDDNVIDNKGMLVINKTITLVNYQVTLPFIINPDWNRFLLTAGLVNNDQFIGPSGISLPAGTVRYDGINGITKWGMGIQLIGWSFTFNFAFNVLYWNKKLTLENGAFVNKELKPNLFGKTALMKLLDPTQPFNPATDIDDGGLIDIQNINAGA